MSDPGHELKALASELQPVPGESSRAYSEHLERLLGTVNQAMEARPDIVRLVGDEGLELMYMNHRHHADFMANVFRYGTFELLGRVVVWVYRSYRMRGFSPEYFLRAMEGWMGAIRHHLPAEAAGPLLEVYQWILDSHPRMLELSSSPLRCFEADEVDSGDRWSEARDRYLRHALRGDMRGCMEQSMRLVEDGDDLAELYLQVFHPALVRVGRLWETGEISVAQEHLVSAVTTRIMASSLYERFVSGSGERGRAIVSAAPNEFHEIGARMVGDFLEMDNWDVSYLGSNTPAGDVASLAAAIRPRVLLLSVGMPFNLARTERLIRSIRELEGGEQVKIIVGGVTFLHAGEVWRTIGADALGTTPRDAVALARKA